MVIELRTLANHSDTSQMTAGHIVDEVGWPVLLATSPQAAAVLSTSRFTAPRRGLVDDDSAQDL